MNKTKDDYTMWTMDALKHEYVKLCFGAMIYGAKTEAKRRKIAVEIDRRESR